MENTSENKKKENQKKKRLNFNFGLSDVHRDVEAVRMACFTACSILKTKSQTH